MSVSVANHFQDLKRQSEAVRLGVMIFLVSETLLFSGLFSLWGAGYAAHGAAFTAVAQQSDFLLGSINTGVLLISSGLVAAAVTLLARGRSRISACLLCASVALGVLFLCLKGYEYSEHIQEGLLPGGHGDFFKQARDPGLIYAITLYWLLTGLHALHLIAGIVWLTYGAVQCWRRHWSEENAYLLICGGYFWHMIDILWIVIWPLFYLVGKQ